MNNLVRFAMVAFYPRVGEVPGLAELGVDAKIARLRRETTFLFWAGMVGAAVFFQISPILTLKRPWLAVFLDAEELDRHAHGIATYPSYIVRQIVVLLKLMAGIFWGESPEIRGLLHMAPYGADPASRRLEAEVAAPVALPRAPSAQLVELGRREVERGRVDHESGKRIEPARAAGSREHAEEA